MCDTDRYTYIMTYSFPCTDLSSVGKQAGMSRDSGTRSGLLWQVERLLKEMDELPQILLMENVPEVVSDKNMGDFAEWIAFLDSLGYRSKYEILNAKYYGIPQNRDRCYMVSWLGDYYYDFPERLNVNVRLIDLMEEKVDEKYYLSEKQVANLVLSPDFLKRERERAGRCGRADAVAQTDIHGTYSSKIVVAGSLNPQKTIQQRVQVLSPEGISGTICATDYKDPAKILTRGGLMGYTQKHQHDSNAARLKTVQEH